MQIAIFLFYVLYFRIICESGLSADDMWNSNVQSAKYIGGYNAWEITWRQLVTWLQLGRVFPFSNYVALLFSLLPTVAAYKACIVGMTWLNSVVCGWCLKIISKSNAVQFLCMLIFPIFLQLTPEFDSGLYCYHMLIQMTVHWCFLSLWCTLKYREKQKRKFAVFSAVSLFIALGTYEVAFVFIFAILWVIGTIEKNWKKTLKICFPNLAVFIGMVLANVIARLFIQEGTYQGIAISLSIKDIFLTLIKQCSTSFPIGRYICSALKYCEPYSDVYPYTISELISQLQIWDVFAMLIFVVLVWLQIKILIKTKMPSNELVIFNEIHGTEMDSINNPVSDEVAVTLERITNTDESNRKNWHWTVIGLGLIVFLFPGMLIAVSAKYQQILGWCSGHLPAYMQSIGLAIAVTGCSCWLIQRLHKKWKINGISCGCIAIASVIILLNLGSGRAGVEYMNRFRKYPQDNISNAANAGFFDEISQNDSKIVFGTTSYIYDSSNSKEFYSKFAQMRIIAIPRQQLVNECIQQFGMLDNYDMSQWKDKQYYGVFNMTENGQCALIMGYCTSVTLNETSTDFEHVWIENPRVYIHGDMDVQIPSEWILIKQEKDYVIYKLEGTYDIMQSEEYYRNEVQTGVLYQEER